MGWRSVMITQPAFLSLAQHAVQIHQGDQKAHVPLEDMSVLVLDHPQITLTGQLLTACAEEQVCVITVDAQHQPNGLYLPFLPHSRLLKVMRAQLALSQPTRKRLHQALIRAKIRNQAALLLHIGALEQGRMLFTLAENVRSGDSGHAEPYAAQLYFTGLFGKDFLRRETRFHNAALNYTYAVVRAAIARALVVHGFLPAFGLFHCNEQNAFNLADDLIEPYRAFADRWVLQHFPTEEQGELCRQTKAQLVALLHQDIVLDRHGESGACTMLAAIDASVASLGRIVQGARQERLCTPDLAATLSRAAESSTDEQ